MSYYKNHIYPWLINKLADPEPIQNLRKRIIPLAKGDVLEIGTGPGVNFAYYNPDFVTKLFALEPNKGMIRFSERERKKTCLNVEYIDLPGERIPLQDDSVDTVVSTFTFGSISSLGEALQGVQRVLKPTGKLLFCEICLSPDLAVQRWQARWKPITSRVFQGLDLTKDIAKEIEQSFQIEQIDFGYFDESSSASKAWTHYCLGVASKRA